MNWVRVEFLDQRVVVAAWHCSHRAVGSGVGVGVVRRLVLEQSALRERIIGVPVRPALRQLRIGHCIREGSPANALVAAVWEA